MAALLESNAKHLLATAGIPVPRGVVCTSPEQAGVVAQSLASRVAVKALVPSKNKLAAGGIRFADTPAEAASIAADLLATVVAGFPVASVLVEAFTPLAVELYCAVELDVIARSYRLTVAAHGGTHVEAQLARGAARELHFLPNAPPTTEHARDLLRDCGAGDVALHDAPAVIAQLAKAALDSDATLIEVNPLGIQADGRAIAIGVLCAIDDSALYRQPEIARSAIAKVDQVMRSPTAWEHAVDVLNHELPDGGDIRFGEFPDGDIGMMVLGGGAGLVALDAVARAHGRPANYLDMTSAAGQAEEKLYRLTRLFLAQPHLRGLFVGSNIGAFLPVPVRMRGLTRALRECLPLRPRFPVVIRLAGIDDEQAIALAEGLGIRYFRDEVTLEEAIEVFMDDLRAVA